MGDLLSRINGPENIGNGNTDVFTGTGGHTYTIRNTRIINNTAAAITVKLGIGATGAVADTELILGPVSIPASGGLLNHDCFIVMSGTENLKANATATGTTITISGLDQS